MHTAPPEPRIEVRLQGAGVTREGRALLRDLRFNLLPGEHWAVLGENGAGKSTFLRLVRGDMAPDDPRTRTYRLDGEVQGSPIGLRQRMALVSAALQDFYVTSESEATALEVVLAGFFDAPLLYEEPEPELRERALAALQDLDAADLAERPMRILSQGQARRVLLARALATDPDILLLDEFLDGLDSASRSATLKLLERAGKRATLLCTAHRAEDLPRCIRRALVLEQGRVRDSGPAAEVLARYAAGAESPEPGRWSLAPSLPREEVLLRIRDASVDLDGTRALRGISWEVRAGENWAVLGRNGAGKSTLIRLVLALEHPSALDGQPGTVERFGDGGESGVLAARSRMALVSPALQAEYTYDLPVQEVVWSGFTGSIGLWEEPDAGERRQAAAAMEFFGLAKLAKRRLRSLSYGQQRRVFLARALVGAPDLLLLDEPFSGLDAASRSEARALLQRLAEAGQRFLLVTHRAADMPPAVNRVLELESGRVAFSGTREEYDGRGPRSRG